jgi:hypothetical protein
MQRTKFAAFGMASLVGLGLFAVSRAATAQLSLPYTGSCNNEYNCFQVTDSYAGDGWAIGGKASGANAWGVEGLTTYPNSGSACGGGGVYAAANCGYGVLASSDTNYAVSGTSTNNTGIVGVSQANGYSGVAGVNSYGGYAVSGWTNGGGGYAGYFDGVVKVTGELYVGSCSGCTSDVRLKTSVHPLTGALEQLLKLKGVTFEWKAPSEHENEAGRGLGTQTGFIAQDVETVFPGWVKQDGYTAPDGQKYKTLELRQIEALEVESIRSLKSENDALKERVAALENGRRPMISSMNGLGLGVGGLAIAGALVLSRRRRDQHGSAK